MKEDLKTIGSILWWAEGSKSVKDKRWKNAVSYPIEITNTNPEIIIIFMRYITEIVGIPKSKIKVQLQIHKNDNQQKLEQYWSDITGISLKSFNKTIIRPTGKKPGKNNGTCKIRCYSKEYYDRIQCDLRDTLKLI